MNNEQSTQTAEETTALPRNEEADQAAPAEGQETQDSLDVDSDVGSPEAKADVSDPVSGQDPVT